MMAWSAPAPRLALLLGSLPEAQSTLQPFHGIRAATTVGSLTTHRWATRRLTSHRSPVGSLLGTERQLRVPPGVPEPNALLMHPSCSMAQLGMPLLPPLPLTR